MKHKKIPPPFFLAAIVGFAFAPSSIEAAEISISPTAPVTDGDDIWNYAPPTGTQKWFNDREKEAGQTFTPTADGLLNSFTIYLSSRNANDGGNENVDIRLGTISRPDGVFTFTDVYSENAAMAPSPEGDWEANDYITFTFDTPQAVSAGVEYGIITDAQAMGDWRTGGIPYRHRTGNDYLGGSMINRGGEIANSDLVFHVDIGPAVSEVPLAITDVAYLPESSPNPTVTLTWRNTGAETYAVKYSRDLNDWSGDLDASVAASRDENPTDVDHITVTFPLMDGLEVDSILFFRLE